MILLFWSYALFVYQSEYCLYLQYIISIINSDNNLKKIFWEIRSNKNFRNPKISIFLLILHFRYFLALLSNWWWILYYPLLWMLSESDGIRLMGLWFVYVYNLEVTYIEVWYNLNGSYIKSYEKAWLNRSERKLLAMAVYTWHQFINPEYSGFFYILTICHMTDISYLAYWWSTKQYNFQETQCIYICSSLYISQNVEYMLI